MEGSELTFRSLEGAPPTRGGNDMIRFGVYRIDPHQRQLFVGTQLLKIENIPLDVLLGVDAGGPTGPAQANRAVRYL